MNIKSCFCLHTARAGVFIYEQPGAEWQDMGIDDEREMLRDVTVKMRCVRCNNFFLEKMKYVFRNKITHEYSYENPK